MERLSPLDAAFVEAEDADRHTSMAIASIAIFDGPPPDEEDLVRAYAARLPLIPRYRQRLRRPPFDLGPPVWIDDPDFDVYFHVRRAALAAPGGQAELDALMARVMAHRLDRDRPLWETWVVEGLQGGAWALISKVHHCMVDGVAGTELYHLLLSSTPEDEGEVTGPPPPLERGTSSLRVMADGLEQLALTPVRQARLAMTAARHPLRTASRTAVTARGLLGLGAAVVPVRQGSLVGGIGKQRRYTATSVPLHDVKDIAHHHGATVNDVALAAVTAGFRAVLLARGEPCTPHSVRSLVPTSIRPPGAESELANRVSCMLANLPVHVADPTERLLAVHEELWRVKRRQEAEAGAALVELAGYGPFVGVGPLIRFAMRAPQWALTTVTTNVPGPREPLYLMGRRMRRMLPFVPIADRIRTGIAIISYCDELSFGITADYDSGGDIDVLADGIGTDIDALRASLRRPPMAMSG